METSQNIRYAIEGSIRFLESNSDLGMDRCDESRRKWDGA
jgi:hypothetical protein